MCAIIIKSDYSSFTADILYHIMQQWPWQPITAIEGEEEVTVLQSLPSSRLWQDRVPQTLLYNQHTILHQHLFDTHLTY
jgi:hypothetical protein